MCRGAHVGRLSRVRGSRGAASPSRGAFLIRPRQPSSRPRAERRRELGLRGDGPRAEDCGHLRSRRAHARPEWIPQPRWPVARHRPQGVARLRGRHGGRSQGRQRGEPVSSRPRGVEGHRRERLGRGHQGRRRLREHVLGPGVPVRHLESPQSHPDRRAGPAGVVERGPGCDQSGQAQQLHHHGEREGSWRVRRREQHVRRGLELRAEVPLRRDRCPQSHLPGHALCALPAAHRG